MITIDEHKKSAEKAAISSVLLNLIFAISKGLAGVFGNSFALVADAIESLSDVFSSILVYLGVKYSVKPVDKNHPYGHGKIEPLITFIIVGFLICSSFTIAYHAILSLNQDQEKPKLFTIIVLVVVIVIKELMYRFVEKKGEDTNSTVLQAEAWHHRSDAISSAMALIGILIAIIGGENYRVADEYAAIITAIIILINAYLIFRPALGEIMDEDVYSDIANDIRINTKKYFPETETEKINIRKSGMFYYVDLHLMVEGQMSVSDGHTKAHEVKNKLEELNPYIANILIHIEPIQ